MHFREYLDKLAVQTVVLKFLTKEEAKMLYSIGIDISKFKHDIAAINSDGEVIKPSWTFYNSDEGFSSLKEFLAGISGEIRIGFESTGHYGQNLKLFLEANHYTFMEFNPLVLKKFVASKTLRRTKTDSLDAISIAQYLMTVEYKPYPSSFYHIEALKVSVKFPTSFSLNSEVV